MKLFKPFLPAALIAVTLAGWGVISPAVPASEKSTPGSAETDEFQGLPEGLGREEVFYTCQACHSLAIVKQQGLNRDSWDESLVWMVEEQEMAPLEPEDRKLILDYLTRHYGRTTGKKRQAMH